jgi:riboflavin-specific deaminase-like protein
MILFLLYLTVVVWSIDAFIVRPMTTSIITIHSNAFSVRESRTTAVVYASEKDEDGCRPAPTSNLDIDDPPTSTLIWPLGTPSVTLKMAFDSQGGVADLSTERSERFTCSDSLDMVHRLRRVSDAVLVGRSTVKMDDCTLTVRRVEPVIIRSEKQDGTTVQQQQPVRVILDPNLAIQVNKYQIALDGLPTVVVHAATASMDPRATYAVFNDDGNEERKYSITTRMDYPNVTYLGIPSDREGKLSMELLCSILSTKFNIRHVMVEGGPTTARQFLKHKMVDRAIFVYAPISFEEPLPSYISKSSLEEAGLALLGSSMCGVDKIEYYSRPDQPWPTESLSSWP